MNKIYHCFISCLLAMFFACALGTPAIGSTPVVSGTWSSGAEGPLTPSQTTWLDAAAINSSTAIFVGKVEPGTTYAAIGYMDGGVMTDLNTSHGTYNKILYGVDYQGSGMVGSGKAIAVGEGGAVYRLNLTRAMGGSISWSAPSSLSKPSSWTGGYLYTVDILD